MFSFFVIFVAFCKGSSNRGPVYKVGQRVQTNYEVIGGNVYESEYRITLRNHKEQDIVVQVVEPMPSDWRIVTSSMPFEKRDAQTAVFSVPVKANGEAQVTYHVRVRY